jgi:hypothetical protein
VGEVKEREWEKILEAVELTGLGFRKEWMHKE